MAIRMERPLVLCHQCGIRGNSDRNVALIIGKRLVAHYQKASKENPPTLLKAGRTEQSAGGVNSQDVKSVGTYPSYGSARHGDHNEHGTAHETGVGMVTLVPDIAHQLRFSF